MLSTSARTTEVAVLSLRRGLAYTPSVRTDGDKRMKPSSPIVPPSITIC